MEETSQKIINHLLKVNDATANKITEAIKMTDTPSVVITALNDLRTRAVIDCEKRKGLGNELHYWLVDKQAAAQAVDKNNGRKPAKRVTTFQDVSLLRADIERLTTQRDAAEERSLKLSRALADSDQRLGLIGTMLINIKGDSIEEKLGKVMHDIAHATASPPKTPLRKPDGNGTLFRLVKIEEAH